MPKAQHAGAVALPLPRPSPLAWRVFALLFALMVVNYVDRQVVASMFPYLKSEWVVSDRQLGALASIVPITIAILTVPLALLSDRHGPVRCMALMAVVWSAATLGCGLAQGYGQLLGMRAVVGVGEAAYGAVGAALLATLFPARVRSTVIGGFLAASLFGSVLGTVLGGVVAEHWGWRAAFAVAGAPGIALALLLLAVMRLDRTVHDPRRSDAPTWPGVLAIVGSLLRSRTLVLTCVGAGLQLVVVSTLFAWLPSYLVNSYGLTPSQAGFKASIVVLVAGGGTVLWSVGCDAIATRMPGVRLYAPAAAALATAAFMWAAFVQPPGATQYALMLVGATMMTGTVGPAATTVADIAPSAARGTALAVLALSQNLFGLAAGPLIAGFLSDDYGMPFALLAIPAFCLPAAAAFVAAARTYGTDVAAARAGITADATLPACSTP
jgi:MFS family permease